MASALENAIRFLASTGAIGSRERDVLIAELEAGDLEIDQWGNVVTAADGYWDDLRFPAQSINPAGSAAPPSVDTDTIPGTLLFAFNADNHVAGVGQMPHAWQRGTNVRPHIHWAKTTTAAGAIAWQLRYAVLSIGDTFTAYSDWVTGTLAVSDSNTVGKHALTTFGEINMAGHKESCLILWELRRDVSEDSVDAAVRLFELDFHYRTNKTGTKDEIPAD